MAVIFFCILIFFIIIFLIYNKKENFNNNTTAVYKPVPDYDISLISQGNEYQYSYFNLKNSNNNNLKYFLLYNKYIDILNKYIDFKLLENSQTLNSNSRRLNDELNTYLFCKDIFPKSPKYNNIKRIEYSDKYLDLIMIGKNLRLDDKLQKAQLIYNVNIQAYSGIYEGLDATMLQKYSNSVDIGFNPKFYSNTINYLKTPNNYANNISSIQDFLLAMCAIIYNYCIKYLNHCDISINNIIRKNTNSSKYLNILLNNRPPEKSTYFINHHPSTPIDISYNKNMDPNGLRARLRKKVNPINNNEGTTVPEFKVNLQTLEIIGDTNAFNNLLSKLTTLNTKLEKTNSDYLKQTKNLEQLNERNNVNKSKYFCKGPADTKTYSDNVIKNYI